MNFQLLKEKPRLKYTAGLLVVLIIVQQIAGWSIRETFVLYKYQQCTQYMNNQYSCEQGSKQVIHAFVWQLIPSLRSFCPSPTSQDCWAVNSITSLFMFSLLAPLFVLGYLILFYFLYYLLTCKIYGVLQFQQVLWIICYVFCLIFQFVSAKNVTRFSSAANANMEVSSALIGMGTLSVLIIINIVILNYDLHLFFQSQFQSDLVFEQTIYQLQIITEQYKDQQLVNIILSQQQKIIHLLQRRKTQFYEQNPQLIQQVEHNQQIPVSDQTNHIPQIEQEQDKSQVALVQ